MNIKASLINSRINSLIQFVLLLGWFNLFLPICVNAQTASDIENEFSDENQLVAPVKVDGKVLFKVRGISSYTADQRALAISTRIIKVAADTTITTDSLKILADKDLHQIFCGETLIMNVYEMDAKLEKISRGMLAEAKKNKIIETIKSYRNDRSVDSLVSKSVHALIAAALLILIMIGLLWLIKKINIRIQERYKTSINSVDDKSFNLIKSDQLWKAFQIVFRTLKVIIIVVVLAVFLQYILSLFPWTNNIAAYTLELILNPILIITKNFVKFLPSLAFLVVIFIITRYLLKLIKLFFTGIGQGAIEIKDFDPDWAIPTYNILRIVIIAFAVIIAYPYIPGSESMAFKGVSVFIGLLFSLGSSSFISNVIAGYSLTYRGAYKIGDRIKVGETVGIVIEQKLLATRLRSLKNEVIIIPNFVLLNSNIVNYNSKAKELGLILHTTVGIGYETPWRQVDAMLKLAADRTSGLLKKPEPFVLKQSLGDFAVNYEINAYCNDVPNIQFHYNELHQHILDVFNENNVQIMTPAYEDDPEIPKVVPKDQWNTPLTQEGK
ncbi:MAG: mechanosensitive ion channel family protein [Bacteroidales bacterium]